MISATSTSMRTVKEINYIEFSQLNFIRSNKGIEYVNAPCAFDIETTSMYYEDRKVAFMYAWALGINETIYHGRTWEEFLYIIKEISRFLNLDENRRIIIYVHNLAFEFQFMYKLFEWTHIFSLKKRKPVYAISDGIEFRCSYLLSGYRLEKLGSELTRYKVQKLVGDLDYDLVRHSKTPMTAKELAYLENDVRVVLAYIKESIEDYYNNITYIPLTNTGRVRNHCRRKTLRKNHSVYYQIMRSLTLEPQDYKELKEAFQGGFTHASYYWSRKVLNNVTSYDFTSAYPYVMLSEYFPMSSPTRLNSITKTEFLKYIDRYCCIFCITYYDIIGKDIFEHIISESKCISIRKPQVDNGRVTEAKELTIFITEIDFKEIEKFYDYREYKINSFFYMVKGYLPKEFIEAILDLYEQKTTLKDVVGMEIEYQRSKGMLNASYGMCVTDIARDEIIFSKNEWSSDEPDLETVLSRYNRSKRRFLYYPWGIWVTAYARRNLYSGILEFKGDYIYSDTDSIKVLNADKHKEYIENYNKSVKAKLLKMCNTYDIPFSRLNPKTKDGKEKLIGVWECEGTYKKFKTIGAKRYMYEKQNGDIVLTVAGINKKLAVPYLKKKYGTVDNIFEAFDDGLVIPRDHSGKLTHTYIDEEDFIECTDYLGIKANVVTPSGIHLEKSEYELSMSADYIMYLQGVEMEMV